MKTIAVLNQKGGVGKTSTCHHVAGSLARKGKNVLLIDNDPQASLTQGFFGPVATRAFEPWQTIDEILRDDDWLDYSQMIQGVWLTRKGGIDRISIVPGSKQAARHNVPWPWNAPEEHRTRLARYVNTVGIAKGFPLPDVPGIDVCLIDCPPNLHLCSWAALAAADWLLVPTMLEDYGAQGLADVAESFALVRENDNPRIELLGYLPTLANVRKSIHQVYLDNLREMYGDHVFATVVPHAVDYVEAIAHRLPIAYHKPRSTAAKAMDALADELIQRMSVVTSEI